MRKGIFAAIVLVVIFGGYYGVNAIFSTSVDIPVTTVQQGEFQIAMNVNGEIDARQAYVVSAPRIRGLQITWLAPEGSMVKAGDPVIRFDATKQQVELQDDESALKIAKTALERANQEYNIQQKQLELELQQAQRNYDEMKYEAPKLAEEARLKLELAQLNHKAKLDQIRADVEKAKLEVQRAQDKVDAARRELEQLTITAPIPGMVVYLEIWKGGNMSKVQEGDSPWPGQGLINLPDLSEMVLKATASEVDASVIDSGQPAIVKVDAFPEKTYHGHVVKKGTLARKK
ncbi:MAG: HlyD family efflux transporter periplasmic adaptor subunit, partial [Candidatus Zixiibacteriota bacterium]